MLASERDEGLTTVSNPLLDTWRSIIYHGRMVSTYKLALAKCLICLARAGRNRASLDELAEMFLDTYIERLSGTGRGRFQMSGRGRTVMEQIIEDLALGYISPEVAIKQVRLRAFRDVLHRFHNVGSSCTEVKFFQTEGEEIVMTEECTNLLSNANLRVILLSEICSHWADLECRFEGTRRKC